MNSSAPAASALQHGTHSIISSPEDRQTRRRKDIIKELKTELDKNRLVIITGAGVTMNALTDESGTYPPHTSWKGLISEGLSYLVDGKYLEADDFMVIMANNMINQGDLNSLLLAATILKTQLEQRGQYSTWLTSVFGTLGDDVQTNTILDALKALHNKGAVLVTTNYDDILDKHCGLASFDRSNQKQVQDFQAGMDGVFHVHGCFKNPEAVVLDIKDYFAVQQSEDARGVMETLLRWKTCLFVGCGEGVYDPNFHALLQWAGDKQQGKPNKHVVLLRDRDPPSHNLLRALRYGPEFSDLGPFLSKLLEADSAPNSGISGPARATRTRIKGS